MFKNLENSAYPGGQQVGVFAIYPAAAGQQTNFAPRTIPPLQPGEEKPSGGWYDPAQILADGTVLFRAVMVGPVTLPSVDLVAPDGTIQGPQNWTAITWFNVELMRDIYTFYALMAATISLVGLAAEKIVGASWLLGFCMLLAFVFVVIVVPDP